MVLRRSMFAGAAGVFLSALIALTADAQGTSVSLGVQDHDSSQPVEITSQELAVDQENGTATFTGDVIVGQGGITMTCQRMIVEYAPDESGQNQIEVIRMSGDVTFVGDNEAAESDAAIYRLDAEIIVMTGNVLVTQGSTALSSDKLTYNLQTGSGVMEGRVKTILQPGGNN
ncbi:MAG: lipopolysaccharide transport periplasmic protein LptA [Rhodobacter sp.]|nr:lipopolysaccharide transport periplasmic protein LptA [Rhodobacter sp.]